MPRGGLTLWSCENRHRAAVIAIRKNTCIWDTYGRQRLVCSGNTDNVNISCLWSCRHVKRMQQQTRHPGPRSSRRTCGHLFMHPSRGVRKVTGSERTKLQSREDNAQATYRNARFCAWVSTEQFTWKIERRGITVTVTDALEIIFSNVHPRHASCCAPKR